MMAIAAGYEDADDLDAFLRSYTLRPNSNTIKTRMQAAFPEL